MPQEKTVIVIPFATPEASYRIRVRPNDTYEFVDDVSTRAGHTHRKGDTLFVVAQYNAPAWGELGPRGYNWACTTLYGASVWTTLETCIERGLLRLVGRESAVVKLVPTVWERLLDVGE